VIERSHLDLIQRPLPAVFVTLLPNGRPQASVVWFSYTDGNFHINSERGRLKLKNVERDKRVTLLIVDPENQHRYLEIRGDVDSISEEGALAHRALLDRRYLGEDHFSDPAMDKGLRVIISIHPIKVVCYG
jgi:PPOX class probable F420-dependent enzyme